jgi:iron complex outermembrane receptor protein
MSARLCRSIGSAVLALLFSSVSIASAQSPAAALDVHVVDPSGAPVAGARVRASTRDGRVTAAASTDPSGNARLEVPGDRLVEVDASGFARLVEIVPAGRASAMLSLALAAVTETVVVTGTGSLETLSETAKAVDVVAAAEIDARGEFSVADAVRTVPGLTVQQLGGPGAFTSIKLRGLREQDTAVLIDGMRFRDPTAPQGDATGFVGELYLANLDRIEVLRGSGSSVHGSHAIGGAINLITRTGGGRLGGDAAVDAGQLGFSRMATHVGGGWRDVLGYSIGASHTNTSDGVDGDDKARNTSVQGRGDLRLFSSGRVTVGTYLSGASSALNETPSAIGPLPLTGFVKAVPSATFVPSVNDPDFSREGGFASVRALLEHRASQRVGYSVGVHHLATERVYVDGPLGTSAFEPVAHAQSTLRGSVTTVDLRGDVDWTSRHVTTARYELEWDRYDSESLPADRLAAWDAALRQTSHSVSVQHQFRPAAWQVALGARAQAFALSGAAFEPTERAPFAAASFDAPPAAVTGDLAIARRLDASGTKLRMHAGNAYRAPAAFERAGASFGARGYTVYGDPRLGPERALSFDAGVDQALANNRMQVAATWFHSRLQRAIAFGGIDRAIDPFGRSFGYRTADGRTARGVELSAQADPTRRTRLKASYTFADAGAPAGGTDGLPRAAAVPAHQLSVLVLQQVQRIEMSFQLEAASDHYVSLFDSVSFGSRAYQFDGIVKADLVATYTHALGRARIRLVGVVDNIFDREHFVQGFRTAGRVARLGVGVAF